MECENQGSGRKQGTLPPALLQTAEEVVLQQLALGAELTVPAITQLLGTCIDVWNEEVQQQNKEKQLSAVHRQSQSTCA